MVSQLTRAAVRPAARLPDPRSAARALGVASVAAVAVAVLYGVFVRTSRGQHADQVALTHLGWSMAERKSVSTVLDAITIGGLAIMLAGCVLVAVLRRRWAMAVGAVVIVAVANLATQLLKHRLLPRPDHGYGELNSLPSGHTTVAASLTMAALLVVPRNARWPVAMAGAVSVAVTGVSTVVAGWHRPSDVVAGVCVALTVAAVVVAALSVGHGTDHTTPPAGRMLLVLAALPVAAAVLLALGIRSDGSSRDLVVHVVIMGGLATCAAALIGLYARMVDTRFS
jgi:membrane-associated phospholipid phosphatase